MKEQKEHVINDSIIVKDNFVADIEAVRASAVAGGFGNLMPAQTEMGAKKYEGMGFLGRHDLMMRSLVQSIGRPVFPGAMFFRVTKPETETYIHSDRGHGDWTCICYLSDHDEISGTAFYKHRKTGWREMPSPEEMKRLGILSKMDECMRHGKEEDWERLDFIRGIGNRAIIFHAPLFHARVHEKAAGEETERLVWVCHFYV